MIAWEFDYFCCFDRVGCKFDEEKKSYWPQGGCDSDRGGPCGACCRSQDPCCHHDWNLIFYLK